MSEKALDLRRSMQIVRRHKFLVGFVVVLGIAAGAAYAVLKPPMLTSTALVALQEPASVQQSNNNNHHHRWSRYLYGHPRDRCG